MAYIPTGGKHISEMEQVTPESTDKIVVERDGESKVGTVGDMLEDLNDKVEQLNADLTDLDNGDNANVWAMSGGEEIPANADLNDYTDVGNYNCGLNTTAATIANSPISQGFMLKVLSPTTNTTYRYRTQILMRYDSQQIYIRGYSFQGSNQGWFDWYQIGMASVSATSVGEPIVMQGDEIVED